MRRGIEFPAHFRCLQFVRKEAGKVRVRVVCIQFGQNGSLICWKINMDCRMNSVALRRRDEIGLRQYELYHIF